MIVLSCRCLNVRVHGKGATLNSEEPTCLSLPSNLLEDTFFKAPLYPVTLDLAGVTLSQKFLCKFRTMENWTVTTCMCCAMDVFAKHVKDHDNVLVSSSAETNSSHISSLMDSEQYSSLFKLILPNINDNFIQNNIGIEFQNGNIHHSIELVQKQVSRYLKDEQKAMEERIKEFSELQQTGYANLLQKVRKNKQAMVYLMMKNKENDKSNEGEVVADASIGSPSVLNKESTHDSSTSNDSAFDKSEASEIPVISTAVKLQNPKSLRRTLSNPTRSRTKPKKQTKRVPLSIDVGGVFDMEELDFQEFSEPSDDDFNESENEAIENDEKSDEPHMYATSLPMSIPTFSSYARHTPLEEEDNDPVPIAPEDIAASMRALACSVRDGTEMFGELPRQRLNTGELLAFRNF